MPLPISHCVEIPRRSEAAYCCEFLSVACSKARDELGAEAIHSELFCMGLSPASGKPEKTKAMARQPVPLPLHLPFPDVKSTKGTALCQG